MPSARQCRSLYGLHKDETLYVNSSMPWNGQVLTANTKLKLTLIVYDIAGRRESQYLKNSTSVRCYLPGGRSGQL